MNSWNHGHKPGPGPNRYRVMNEKKEISGVVLDRRVVFTFDEICHACAMRKEWLIEMVHEGVIEAEGERRDDWRFRGDALVRARRAVRLVRDLGLNWPGAALALDLLDRIERIEQRNTPRASEKLTG